MLFSNRKNNTGHVFSQQWVFSGICREIRECFLIRVPERSLITLLKVVKKDYIDVGSIIYSDPWRT